MLNWDEMSAAEVVCYSILLILGGGTAVLAAVVGAVALPMVVARAMASDVPYQIAIGAALLFAEICVPALIAGVCLTIRRRWKK